MSAPVLDRSPALRRIRYAPLPGLLVLIRDSDDLLTRLAPAAEQARTEHRRVLVALVEPPRPFTIDAAIQARHERRRENERAARVAEALEHCAGVPEVDFAHLERPWLRTAAATRRSVLRRAQRLARRTGHVLYP